jgi:hypothetical protein
MGMTAPANRFAAWVAAFALLLGSLAPSTSHVLAAGTGAVVAEGKICTAAGSTPVRVPADEAPVAPVQKHKGLDLHDCPLCLTHAGSGALAPPAAIAILQIDAASFVQFAFYSPLLPLFTWAAGQPRAPPLDC